MFSFGVMVKIGLGVVRLVLARECILSKEELVMCMCVLHKDEWRFYKQLPSHKSSSLFLPTNLWRCFL